MKKLLQLVKNRQRIELIASCLIKTCMKNKEVSSHQYLLFVQVAHSEIIDIFKFSRCVLSLTCLQKLPIVHWPL